MFCYLLMWAYGMLSVECDLFNLLPNFLLLTLADRQHWKTWDIILLQDVLVNIQ